jgi:carboxypeptidase Q
MPFRFCVPDRQIPTFTPWTPRSLFMIGFQVRRPALRPRAAAALFAAGLLTAPAAAVAQTERVDARAIERIRDEGLNRSQVPQLAGHLTEVIGPRLTGSTGMKRANEWTAETFRSWGLTNVAVEPWGEFGRGWEHIDYYGRITTPWAQPLIGQPLAWTGSTNGTVSGEVLLLTAETPAELFERFRGRVAGRIVLRDPAVEIEPEFRAWTRRFTEADLADPIGERTPVSPDPAVQQAFMRRALVNSAIDSLLRMERPAAILRASPWQYGIIRVASGGSRAPGSAEAAPTVMIATEQYNMMVRNAARGVPMHVELNVRNRFLDDDTRGYNTLAEIRGSDRADEYVMIGAHLDSWHSGQGATDNAAGSVVMMEAMRILKTLGLQPRRTIRIALWSGEEQGLLGSRGWVNNNPALWPRISAYLNLDNGTGRIRGVWNQTNPGATPVFQSLLAPFRDLDVIAIRHGNTGGTDHLAFDAQGIPGFNFIQDPIEYSLRTHHSNMDTFDRLVLDDLKQAAVVVASTAYHLAMRDEMMPRKTAAAQR